MIINVVHAVPFVASSYEHDHDGFTAAMELLAQDHEVRWINVHPSNKHHTHQRARIPLADFVLVRSDWGWFPCAAADEALFNRPDIPAGLLIAGSSFPPKPMQQRRFDVLFYETSWYAPFVAEHPFAVEAFGVDGRYMRNQHKPERNWDWMMVGRLAPFKRPEELLRKQGKRLVVGDLSAADAALVQQLRRAGVVVQDFVPYPELADLYNDATSVLVPCTLQGGGERAVLEARACGCDVEIAADNPKLASLLGTPVPDHRFYASKLRDAIEEVVGGTRIPVAAKVQAQHAARWDLWSDKTRRLPGTLRIRGRSASRRIHIGRKP